MGDSRGTRRSDAGESDGQTAFPAGPSGAAEELVQVEDQPRLKASALVTSMEGVLMRTELTADGYRKQLAQVKRSLWRFEQQRSYAVDYELDQFEKFLAGHPESPDGNPDLSSWFARVRKHASEGRTIGRVRIVNEPITDY
jgi:hypothetical protein